MKTDTQYIQKYVGSEGVYVKYIMIADSNKSVLSILWVADITEVDFVSRLDFGRFPERENETVKTEVLATMTDVECNNVMAGQGICKM